MTPEKILHFEIIDPPTKYNEPLKRAKLDKKTNKIITKKTYYLTTNIFYGNNAVHWSVQYKIINFAKDWLLPFFMEMPKLINCQIKIIYYSPGDNWDLDNKDGFWRKILLDVLKTPTQNQLIKSAKYNNRIRTVEKIKDDTVKHVNALSCEYRRGANKMEVIITGVRLDEQQKLF